MTEKFQCKLEIKKLSKREFEGYGSTFGNKDFGNDIMVQGAFAKTLEQHKSEDSLPSMFWMHQMDRIPGKWLDMSEDAKGLYVKGVLADTELGNEIHTLLGMKAVTGLSIGFIPNDIEYNEDGSRLIKEVELLETSIVSLPMNPKAQIAHAKSRLSAQGEYVPTIEQVALFKRDAEAFLRGRGFSRKLAVTCAANLFEHIGKEVISDPIDEKASLESIPTPDELEVQAGLSDFMESQTSYDLNKQFKKIFG